MSPTTLSYDELKQEFTQQLQKTEHGVLATSDGDYVTAREMMILCDGLKILCFTGSGTRKFKQMEANKNVALSLNNLQIEGEVILKGHPKDDENAGFIRLFQEKYPKVYEFWSGHFEDPGLDLKVIEIIPSKLTAYKSSPDIGPRLDILNVVTETATRVDIFNEPNVNYEQY